MEYRSELMFLRKTFEKCHIQTLLLDTRFLSEQRIDLGLRKLLNSEDEYKRLLSSFLQAIKPRVIYKLQDSFFCRYIILLLPDSSAYQNQALMIGPYLSAPLSSQVLMEQVEKYNLTPRQFQQLESGFSAVPIFSDDGPISAILDVFAETLWGEDGGYEVEDVNSELSVSNPVLYSSNTIPFPDEINWDAQLLETRYRFENELMLAVSQGQTHKVEMLFSSLSTSAFEQRLTDPVRNIKNYCIIMNTLLRKSAESGGVHPVYLDRTSSDFARRIELVSSMSAGEALMTEMFRDYCRLVNKHAIRQYSPAVQKAILQIDTDLAGDMSLKALAKAQNLNASYLSALFKRETGQTITDYVNQKRIATAVRLLSTTNLQVQTIAQYCGILDVNYFSKIFKKYTQKTPKEFRKDILKAHN